jgi:transposase
LSHKCHTNDERSSDPRERESKLFVHFAFDGANEMPRGKALAIMLTVEEREQLKANVQRGDSAGPLAERSRMILLAADGLSNEAIAARLGVRGVTVGTWRRRFSSKRIAGLCDERRAGRPRVIDDAKIREVVAATLETTDGSRNWSTRSMAKQMGMSQSAISRIWRAFGLESPGPTNAKRAGRG